MKKKYFFFKINRNILNRIKEMHKIKKEIKGKVLGCLQYRMLHYKEMKNREFTVKIRKIKELIRAYLEN